MPNPFELLEKNLYAVTIATFGFSASWEVSDGSGTYVSGVHFGDASELKKLSGGRFKAEYRPETCYLEYHLQNLPNLKKRVDSGSNEIISVDGKGRFYVLEVVREYDGDTYHALLQPIIEA